MKKWLAVLIWMAAPGPASGAWSPFEESAFEVSLKQEKIILLQFTAERCSLCDDEERVLVRAFQRPELKNIAGFRVDYEASKEFVRRLKVRGLSTLVLLKGDKELNRAAGIVTESDFLNFLKPAFQEKLIGRPKKRPSNRTQPRP